MQRPKVSIIIVNYNTAREIEKCLQSIQKATSGQQLTEIIVVDNASFDNSVKVIQKFRNVKLIRNKENFGFAKANNIGAREAKGEFLFFLNPDTQVKKDTIANLIKFAKKNPNVIIGSKLLNPNGSVQGSCYSLPTVWRAIREYWLGEKGAYEKFAPKRNRPVQVEAIVGAAMFMPKNIFEKLQGFNEKYFLYYEDLDFCKKAGRFKIPIYYVPHALVIHDLGKAGGEISQLVKSAKIYHGQLKYFLLSLIIFLGQRLRKYYANA